MSKPDKWVNIFLAASILLYTGVLVVGLIKHTLILYIPFMNALTGMAILIYWVQKQLSIKQHYFEGREISVLCIEAIFVVISIYAIMNHSTNSWQKNAQYIIFGIHFTVLILGLFFMLTFKITKLF